MQLDLAPTSKQTGISGDWGRDDGLKLGTSNLALQPLLTLSLDCPSPFMLLWGKEMKKIIPEVPSGLFHDSFPYVLLAFEVLPGMTFPKLLPSFLWVTHVVPSLVLGCCDSLFREQNEQIGPTCVPWQPGGTTSPRGTKPSQARGLSFFALG